MLSSRHFQSLAFSNVQRSLPMHLTVLSGLLFKVRKKKTRESIFQHKIYGTVSKLFPKNQVTARLQ